MARWLSVVACGLGLGGCQVAAHLPPMLPAGAQTAAPHAVIAQLFEWRWTDIAQECEAWLGPKGYGAVQISPPHEHQIMAQGEEPFPWYQRYQPVGYGLTSRSGNRAELAELVSRCHGVGVDVYADVVINPRVGEQDAGREDAQVAIATAMNELLDLGIAGFRIDAAQQVPPQTLANILRRLQPLNPTFHPNGGRPFVYQSVLNTGGDAAAADDYFNNGSVTEFRYGRNLGEQVRYGQLKNLVLFGEAWGLMPSHKAVVFTDNHHTQRSGDHNIVTFYAPDDDGASYRLANVFMLAWPYGTPRVMSSYDWPRDWGTWVGPPADDQGQTLPVSCGDGWVCEHRWSDIANMVEFRNVTQGTSAIDHWWDNGNNQVAFARGGRGFVVINNEDVVLNQTLMTGLPSGIYCNVLSVSGQGEPSEDDCGEIEVTVDGTGQATFEVPSFQAAAIHIGARRLMTP